MIAIYARQSVDKKDSISIETQIEFCKKEISNRDNYNTYIDKGFSGKDINRPSFENMINDIKNGTITKVIVYKLDRISRSTLDFAKIIDIFKKHNIDFISTTEKFDTSTPIGKAMLQIIMIFAELERETIQQRITDSYYARGKKGYGLGGPIPYGFSKTSTIVNGKKTSVYKENLEQSKWLIKMYEMYSDTNMSLGEISAYLNEKKVPAAKGGRWDSGKISRMLRNPIYVKADADIYLYYDNKGSIITNNISEFIGTNGCFLYGKREANERKYTDVTNHVLSIALHKGLVDSDIWLSCQYKLDKNKQLKNSGKGKYTWLSGLTKCGYCGYSVSVSTSNEGKYKYFKCTGRRNLKICGGYSKPIKVEDIENAAEGYIFEKISELKGTTIVVENNRDNNLNKIRLKIIEIDDKINNLVKQISLSNKIVMKYINQEISNLDREKNQLIEEIKRLSLESRGNQSLDEVIEKIKDWNNMSIEDKKGIAHALIEKILIRDDEIEIFWKI